ncbi:hypothetical protein VPHK435_0016 [Vibrio phage K435]
MITCKEDLIGTEFKVTCKEEADLLKEKCKSLGIEHATWSSCNYTDGVMRGVIGKDLGTYHSCKLLFTDKPEDSDSMDEFKSLRFVDTKDLVKSTPTKFVKVEESIFDLKDELERGELYYYQGGEYFKITDTRQLAVHAHYKSAYRKVEIDWRDEVVRSLPAGYGVEAFGSKDIIVQGAFNKKQALILANAIIASLTEKPEGV